MLPRGANSTHGQAALPSQQITGEIPYDANQDHADGPSLFADINYG
jgi:hypothetical protein